MMSGNNSIHERPFDSLPDKRKVWTGSPGSREEGLGRLVLLTPEVVANAAKSCIRSGQRVSLNWDLTRLELANFNRAPTQHHIVPLLGGVAYDDVYIFNPQQSSQWDGLRHFSAPFPTTDNPSRRLFYGGVTASDISNRSNTRIGIQHWAKEGICGRGVLLNYVEYAQRHSITYKALSDHSIPLSVILDVAKEQGSTFRRGDILFVRMGLTKQWDKEMTIESKLEYTASANPQHAGLEGTEEMLRWIWDEGFAAVASDAVSFEVYPPKGLYGRGQGEKDVPGLFMHEYLIAGWGMPVGELFDLEELSERCRQENRWDFFVASSPLNMPGGVSSPPNCLALF
jgi:kynurenine formamidase